MRTLSIRAVTWGVLVIVACGCCGLSAAPVSAQTAATAVPPAAAEVDRLLDQAKGKGARGQLPMAWRDLENQVKAARERDAGPAVWERLKIQARRLLNMAIFVDEVRQYKNEMETLLGHFDQALGEVAALYGVTVDPALCGTAAADQLLDRLAARNLRRQTMIDSLTVVNRRLSEEVGSRQAAQESLITSLQVEVSSLRQRLWETELRAGVAEADRSAAETTLQRRQQREEAVTRISALLDEEEGQVSLTPAGDIVLRLYGMDFAVGSANLQGGSHALVDKLVQAVGMFPGAELRIEGHTDDTGSRQANLRLSRRRAETVARLLEGRLSLAPEAIPTMGHGPDQPIALNTTPEGRARNRRIDVVIIPRP